MASVDDTEPASPNGKFTSYADYLKSIIDKWPEYCDVLEYFQSSLLINNNIDILSVTIAESTSDKLKSQVLDGHPTLEIIRQIAEQKNQLENQEVQLVVVNSFALRSSSRLLDFLGLEYGIDPAFFRAALSFRFHKHSGEFPEVVPNPQSNFLLLPSKLLAHFAKSRNSQGQEISVVIVLLYGFNSSNYIWDQYHSWLLNNRLSPYTSSDSPMIQTGHCKDYLPYYLKLLEKWHFSEPEAFQNNPSLYLGPMVKVIAQELLVASFRLRDLQKLGLHKTSFDNSQEIYNQGKMLLGKAADLSSQIDDFELFTRQYRSFFEYESQPQSAQYLELLRYISEVLDHGTQRVRLIREQMQSEISLWSIEESKRSIEEAISVKRLTQLAFVFIPLSFVTGVFGMNVQEISGTGVQIWVFVITAVVVGASSILVWRLLPLVETWWKKPGNVLRQSIPSWGRIRYYLWSRRRERWRRERLRRRLNL